MNSKKLNLVFLVIICDASAILVLPTINNNINDPNRIVYFNADEGDLMDLIWFYYSGEKRASYQVDIDYGLEMIYLSDMARLLFSRFVDFTPGTFVLILRWFHLISWIGALIALWYFMGYHFQKGWQQILVVLLLAVRPAFNYFSNNLKPEPLVLLVMILGLVYTLKIVERPSTKSLLISTLCAAIAFHIKYAGVFLLPAIIAAMYFGQKHQKNLDRKYKAVFPAVKFSWILELVTGITLILLPVLFILLYVRKSTGITFYQEYGLLGSFLRYKTAFFVALIGLIIAFSPFVIPILNRIKNSKLKGMTAIISEINSYAFIAGGLFCVFLFLIGFRWFFSPENFLLTYSFNFFDFTGILAMRGLDQANVFAVFIQSFISKLKSFDMLIFAIFVCYLIIEFLLKPRKLKIAKIQFYKRMTLLIFLIPCFLSLLSIGRFTQHHMLPFFVVVSILSIQGYSSLIAGFKEWKIFKNIAAIAIGALLIFDIAGNAFELIRLRVYQYRQQQEDIAFEIEDWMYKNIPLDSRMVTDHHARVYIPPKYANIMSIGFGEERPELELIRLVTHYNPRFLYYNENEPDNPLLNIKELLPDKKIVLVRLFENSSYYYQRKPNARFVLYEILN